MSYQPFIIVPPFTSCQNSFIVYGQGTAPYEIFPIASGATGNSTSLENIPIQNTAGYLDWKVDFDVGANITWVVVDSKGQQAYSQYRVVQSNGSNSTTCPKTIYTTPAAPTSPTGAIVGGVVGGLIFIGTLLGIYLAFLRRKRMKSNNLNSREGSIEENDEPEMTSTGGATGVRRTGTFNLHNVQFTDTEASQAALEPPPSYVPSYVKRHFFSNRSSSRAASAAGSSSDIGGSRRASFSPSITEEVEPAFGSQLQEENIHASPLREESGTESEVLVHGGPSVH